MTQRAATPTFVLWTLDEPLAPDQIGLSGWPVRGVVVMVIYSALVRSHQSTYEGSFGPVPLPDGDSLHPGSARKSAGGGGTVGGYLLLPRSPEISIGAHNDAVRAMRF